MAKNLANAQALVEIKDIRQNTLILKDGSLRQVLIAGGINFSLKSEEEQNIITQTYQNFLNSLDFQIQIIVHSRKINIEKYLGMLEERRSQEPSPLLQDQIAEYEEFIRGFVKENAIMTKSFFIVIPWSPVALPGKETFFSSLPFLKRKKEEKEEAAKKKEEGFEENLAQLSQRVNQVVEGLATVGLEAIVLDDEQLIELLYNFYNPEATEKEKISLPSRSQPANTSE
jgi:type IV secretory pathway VirB4 component